MKLHEVPDRVLDAAASATTGLMYGFLGFWAGRGMWHAFFGGVVGFCIGFAVNVWVRRKQREQREREL